MTWESKERIRRGWNRLRSPVPKVWGASAADTETSRDLVEGPTVVMEEYPDMPRQVRLLDQPLRYLHNVGNLLAILFGLGRRPLLRQRPPSPAMDGIALRIAPFGNEALGEPFVERLPACAMERVVDA